MALAKVSSCSKNNITFLAQKFHKLGPCLGSNSVFRLKSSTSDDRYIIPKTVVPTFHYQKSLPRLPIPKLEDTCRRYLDSQKPLLTPEQYQYTKNITEKFQKQEGPALHADLIKKDKMNKHTSYIAELWYDMYLKERNSIVLNHNPFMCFIDDPKPEQNDQLIRATNIIYSAMRFKNALDDLTLEPDIFHLNPKKSDTDWFKNIIRFVPGSLSWYGAFLVKAFPLDMSQYGRLFCSTRIPHPGKDKLATHEGARHMLIMHKGKFFVFDTLTTDGNIVSTSTIYENLKQILNDPEQSPEFPIGLLTTDERETWARLRQAITAIPANQEAMRLIDSAIFTICLDDEVPSDPMHLARIMLHGDGGNRWFDKSFQLVICKQGTSAVNFEHAWGDGVAVLRFFNEVFKDTTTRPALTADAARGMTGESTLRKLHITLTPEIERGVAAAQKRFNKVTGDLDMDTLEITDFGKNHLKSKKVSPDAFMQLAFQMAIYRQLGHFVPTYESCSTAAFRHGRTETIRPASNPTVACSEAFNTAHRAGVDEMMDRIRKATAWHAKLTKEAAMGQGFDRHLFALRTIATAAGQKPDIFEDEAYSRINRIYLSTSTLSSPAILLGGFGPVIPEGLGVGYAIFDDRLGCNVTCYKGGADVRGFLECVRTSINDMHAVMDGKNFKK
ncbi:carnitine O-palmitoyltransferase 2, mitochondrial [Nematostella vectensis]|uniref:carnitine O-palmitoyltransferase 2, mitochondrial n=1 Tax=Nematostella vectensis TaxID=45351 RepID=UPI0020779927|nr:carnitine O-palmitoyltransferase 2, mitochondrial [Nematostella vectensis]